MPCCGDTGVSLDSDRMREVDGVDTCDALGTVAVGVAVGVAIAYVPSCMVKTTLPVAAPGKSRHVASDLDTLVEISVGVAVKVAMGGVVGVAVGGVVGKSLRVPTDLMLRRLVGNLSTIFSVDFTGKSKALSILEVVCFCDGNSVIWSADGSLKALLTLSKMTCGEGEIEKEGGTGRVTGCVTKVVR